jgi:O-antigen ligase
MIFILATGFWKLFKNPIQLSFNLTDILVFFWFGYMLVFFALNSRYNLINEKAIIYIIFLFIYFLGQVLKNNLKNVWQVHHLIALIGLVEAIYCLLQITSLLENFTSFGFGGSFGNPGDVANFLAITYPVALALYLFSTQKKLKWILLISALLQFSIIVISCARTAWLAAAFSSIALLYYYKFKHLSLKTIIEKHKKHWLRLVTIATVLILVFTFSIYKLYAFKSQSANGRVFMYKLSAGLVFEKPIFGHGYNTFYSVQHLKQIEYFKQHPFDTKNGYLADEVVFAFNDYLQMSIEYGISLLLIFILIIWRTLKFKNRDEDLSPLLFSGRVALLSILICMMFSYPLQNSTVFLSFILLISCISAFDKNAIISFKLRKWLILSIAFIVFTISGLIAYNGTQSICYGLKWKKAYGIVKKDPKESLMQYDKIFNMLHNNTSFLKNYSIILYSNGQYSIYIDYYKKYGYLFIDNNMLMLLGQSYEQLHEYSLAEESYKNASYLVPNRFLPKYRLFKLYQKTGKTESVKKVAYEIRNMKIKVFSEDIKMIKTEVSEYISKINNQSK